MEKVVTVITAYRYQDVVSEICELNWNAIEANELSAVALAYYFFSIQFRESLEIACETYPFDERLMQLRDGECDTDNLSPFKGVAQPGERMNHDEFMRRSAALLDLSSHDEDRVRSLGATYLTATRAADRGARASSIASYEDGGLESVFTAILSAPCWEGSGLAAFEHFLARHIHFDSDPVSGHGVLSRHLIPDDRVIPLWIEFRNLLVAAAPALAA